MKSLIANICVSILRKLKVSTIIGYKVDGTLTQLNDYGRIYDCEFIRSDYRFSDGQKWEIPKGKFKFEQEVEQ